MTQEHPKWEIELKTDLIDFNGDEFIDFENELITYNKSLGLLDEFLKKEEGQLEGWRVLDDGETLEGIAVISLSKDSAALLETEGQDFIARLPIPGIHLNISELGETTYHPQNYDAIGGTISDDIPTEYMPG